jgi:hypothetical protein
VSGLLLEMGVTVEEAGWELVDTISSLLLFWFMEDCYTVLVCVIRIKKDILFCCRI